LSITSFRIEATSGCSTIERICNHFANNVTTVRPSWKTADLGDNEMGRKGYLPAVLHLPSGIQPAAPVKPVDMPEDVSDAWDWIVTECMERGSLTTGDAMVVEAAARTWAQYMALQELVQADPADEKLSRLSLAVLRQWTVLSMKLGMNPIDRHRLLSCKISTEKAEEDDLLG
jgi:phage terminase small subunit